MPYAIINTVRAAVYEHDMPGAGGRWFATWEEAQAACDAYNMIHPAPEICDDDDDE